jgi:zinc protease
VIRAGLLVIAVLALSCKTAPVPQRPDDPIVVAPDAAPPVDDDPITQEPTAVTQTATPQELAFPDEAFRAEQPKPAKPRPFQLPKIKPFKLASGVEVYLIEQHTLPIVSIDLNFDGGSIADPSGKEGLASVCMSMLSEGTEALDKVAFAEALADVAASVDGYAGGDTQGVSMSSLTKHLPTVFPLFVDALRKPGFRPTDFDRLIKRRLESLRQSKGSAPALIGRVSGPVLYGAKHPFGRITTEDTLKAITLDDCKAYHAKWLKPGGARLFVVGDLTETEVRGYFDDEGLTAWKGKVPKLPKLAKPNGLDGRIFFVDLPGAKQSEITAMHFGPKRTAKDYFETWIMSSVFGGGFSSRLNMNLREDKGYSYGARGGMSYSRWYGTFTAGSSVVSDLPVAARDRRRAVGAARRFAPDHDRRADPREGGRRAVDARPVRDRELVAVDVPPAGLLRPAARLLRELRRQGHQGDREAGPEGGEQAPRPRRDRLRRRR